MKIDIGPEGEVVGTKRVNQSGTVSGLKAHAGKEVLILASPSPARFQMTLRDRVLQARVQAAASAQRLREEAETLRAKWKAEAPKVGQRVRERAPPAALKAMDKAEEAMGAAQAWMHAKRVDLEQRAEDARVRAQQAKRRVEARAEHTKDDLEQRVRAMKTNIEQGAERRREQVEKRLSDLRDEVEARWRQSRDQIGDQAVKVKVQVKKQVDSLRRPQAAANGKASATNGRKAPAKKTATASKAAAGA